MKVRLKLKNFKYIKNPYPIIIYQSFLDKEVCSQICDDIDSSEYFDDLVMEGRYRINKGSKNFDTLVSSSKPLEEIYRFFNNINVFKNFYNIIFSKKKYKDFVPLIYTKQFNPNSFGEQKTTFTNLLKKKILNFLFKPSINLDLDFSKAKSGYNRVVHRDRETRIISFLLYFNSASKKDGGQFEVYESFLKKNFPRFPEKKHLKMSRVFPIKSGQLIVFLSSPNSYHAAAKYLSKKKNRIFIYGSYSLDREVSWIRN